MAADRDPRFWLKAIGHARGPLDRVWLPQRAGILQRTGFSRRPRMAPGDRLVYYASVWQVVFGLLEVTSEPEQTAPDTRWPWSVAVEPLLVVPDLGVAPPVQSIGVMPRSMSQHSHISLTAQHYAHAAEVIGSVGQLRGDRRAICEHVFVGDSGSDYALFRRALASKNLMLIRSTAANLPQVRLEDALEVCLLLRDREPQRYEPAAVRWIARFCVEKHDVSLQDVDHATHAFALMRSQPEQALTILQSLCAGP